MHPVRTSVALALSFAVLLPAAHAADPRQRVEMPAPMQEHMLANMRDHLVALGEIQAALGKGEFDRAADIAEQRIGMSSLQGHGASHMAPYMPQGMQGIGTAMHRAASRFARIAQETQVQNDLPRSLEALAGLTQQCVACHAGYRLR
jgi:cytochrome c556